MVTVKSYCWRFTLKRGSIYVGYRSAMYHLAGLIMAVYILVDCGRDAGDAPTRMDGEGCRERWKLQAAGFPGWANSTGFWVSLAVVCSAHIILCFYLVMGVWGNELRFIKAWVLFTGPEAALGLLVSVLITGHVMLTGVVALGGLFMLSFVLFWALIAYNVVAVNSYHRELSGNDCSSTAALSEEMEQTTVPNYA